MNERIVGANSVGDDRIILRAVCFFYLVGVIVYIILYYTYDSDKCQHHHHQLHQLH
jgi:hypothetical protein